MMQCLELAKITVGDHQVVASIMSVKRLIQNKKQSKE